MDRAERRHRLNRQKAHVRRIVKRVWNATNPQSDMDTPAFIGRMAVHPKGCDGDCCKNPRRSGWTKGKAKLTVQELKNLWTSEE